MTQTTEVKLTVNAKEDMDGDAASAGDTVGEMREAVRMRNRNGAAIGANAAKRHSEYIVTATATAAAVVPEGGSNGPLVWHKRGDFS